ncbi:4-coumarate-CoA ligase-like 6 [Microsporum canis CBS 113480]|uniref:4-coumarate-CoA ligase-like 6 n=1 Tax=Arthroderma otae (strain ATCC MYA-4605 / CBS 113480) TaxID=554155 RepID=C5FHA1_ARTOC|nr:4-coumarate-CoA ligase-like 6 [Microsporum canis CBS 113480]EEQ28820.1 4-coumarate-CoA ligase-like 6 [Microsporum canis CBS 113480]
MEIELQLDRKSNSLARGLVSTGVKKGDRTTYALFKLGAVLVVSALSHLDASHLIISTEVNLPRRDPQSNIPLLQQIVPDLQSVKFESPVSSLKQIILVRNDDGRVDTSDLKCITPYTSIYTELSQDMKPLADQGLSPTDIVNIQFTSGTTSMPKAACLSHRSILNNGVQIGDRMLLTHKDIVCCPPPLFHCFGCVLGFMATATHGSAIVFPAESFNAIATLKAVQEEKCTALYGVPTMFIEELDLIADGVVPYEGFEHLRTGIAAGSSVPSELMKKLHKTLNLTELTICYGMTETSPVSTMTATDDPIEKRLNTVGKLLPHVEAKVVNPQDYSKTLPLGERGELAVSGYHVMKGYWGAPEKTAAVMVPDSEGKVWMHDLIIRGGENIHPLEVENCLLAHPGISNVSVLGVPDERYGEAVAAFVVAHEEGEGRVTPGEVKSWVREKLSRHLVIIPRLFSVAFFDIWWMGRWTSRPSFAHDQSCVSGSFPCVAVIKPPPYLTRTIPYIHPPWGCGWLILYPRLIDYLTKFGPGQSSLARPRKDQLSRCHLYRKNIHPHRRATPPKPPCDPCGVHESGRQAVQAAHVRISLHVRLP